ncbi:unnamed protein product, partial [Mesorhabditis belari]|uniref:F-box domain-containing protein n=1 Tax=Mesorhabditis belari TaxID=2138241 RepID=A0AAF3F950_9BILA
MATNIFPFQKLPLQQKDYILKAIGLNDILVASQINKELRNGIFTNGPFPRKVETIKIELLKYRIENDTLLEIGCEITIQSGNDSKKFSLHAQNERLDVHLNEQIPILAKPFLNLFNKLTTLKDLQLQFGNFSHESFEYFDLDGLIFYLLEFGFFNQLRLLSTLRIMGSLDLAKIFFSNFQAEILDELNLNFYWDTERNLEAKQAFEEIFQRSSVRKCQNFNWIGSPIAGVNFLFLNSKNVSIEYGDDSVGFKCVIDSLLKSKVSNLLNENSLIKLQYWNCNGCDAVQEYHDLLTSHGAIELQDDEEMLSNQSFPIFDPDSVTKLFKKKINEQKEAMIFSRSFEEKKPRHRGSDQAIQIFIKYRPI